MAPKDEGPKPFAKIDLVSDGSPAADAGLEVGDLVIEFGTQNATNFKSLAEIGQLVNTSIQKIKPLCLAILGSFLVGYILSN
jgi:26S proteasome non-ATPase regulatory subunit 9